MPTEEHTYYDRRPDGTKVSVINRTIAGLDNPWIGEAFQEWMRRISAGPAHRADYFDVAYFLTEYGDTVAERVQEDLDGMTEEELREHVVAIEAERADTEAEQQREELHELAEESDPAELAAALEAAQEAREETDVAEEHAHRDAIDRPEE